MGYGTSFTTEIYLNRQIFNSRYELDDKIKELENYIELSKRELLAFAMKFDWNHRKDLIVSVDVAH